VQELIDEVDEDGAVGRTVWDAPEIDGSVILEGAVHLKPGDMLAARIVEADAYDLWAEPVTSS
jgi:ribosomal protein S12 methylthiotransferase